MLPEFTEAKKYIAKSQEAYFEFSLKHHLGDLFGNIHKRMMPEGNKIRQIYAANMERETEMLKIQTSFDLEINQIKEKPIFNLRKII